MIKSSLCIFIVLSFLLPNVVKSQNRDIKQYMEQIEQNFNRYENQQQRAFIDYRDRINAQFAEYMRQAWPEYKPEPAIPVPKSPEPPAPVVKDPDTPPSNDPIPFDGVTPAPKPVEPPQPVVPLPEHEEPQPAKPDVPALQPAKPAFEFMFYGVRCEVPLEDRHRFRLANATENAFADGWTVLSSDEYLPVVMKCLEYRDELRLGDWGYVRFVEQMTTEFFPSAQLNEARLMQMFILTQSGYKVRMARREDALVLLLPSKEKIYEYSYVNIGTDKYYIINREWGSLNIFDREFPKEQYFSLQMRQQPLLPVEPTEPRHFQSRHDAGLSVDISTNKYLLNFYIDYPLSENWEIYAGASLSEYVKESLYPVLRKSIVGESEESAANILLHFVQTAFEYATDEEQFGMERSLFADETFFYPYSDCEDRAILFSVLVRELLGLDVVLLHYPGHLATAVCFNTEVRGDYLQVDGKRYTVCDPTYINADVGQAMPKFKQTAAQIVRIQ